MVDVLLRGVLNVLLKEVLKLGVVLLNRVEVVRVEVLSEGAVPRLLI